MPDSPRKPRRGPLKRDPHVSDSTVTVTVTSTTLKDSKDRAGALNQTGALNVQKGVEISTEEDDAPGRLWVQNLVSVIALVVYVSVMATLLFSTGAGAEELFEAQIGNGDCPRRPWWWPIC